MVKASQRALSTSSNRWQIGRSQRRGIWFVVLPILGFLIAGSVLPTSSQLVADLIPALVLTGISLVIRLQQGTWLGPAALFAGFWAVLVWLAIIFASDLGASPAALWWIVLSVAVVWIGAAVGIGLETKKDDAASQPVEARQLRFPGLKQLVIVLSVIGFGATIVLLQSRGEGLGALFSPSRLSALGHAFSVDRYSLSYTEPLGERVLSIATYCAAWAAGLLLANPRTRSASWVAFLPLIPATAVAALLTTKASLLFSLVMMAASFLAGRVTLSAGREALFRMRRVAGAAGLLVILLPGMILLQLARYEYSVWNPGQVLETVTRLRIAFFSYSAVFSSWFDSAGRSGGPLHLGAFTFAGAFDLLGLQQRSAGLYTDSVYLGPDRIPSNIYTVFRGLIEDFGLLGSLAVLLVVGFIAGMAFARLRKGDLRYLPILAAFYACSLWSFVVDLFVYNTVVVSWVLFAAYILWSQSQSKAATEKAIRRAARV